MERISNEAMKSLLDLKKHLISINDGKICWKNYDLETAMSPMFEGLSENNKNRILYYGASVLDNNLWSRRIEEIRELLDMDEYYDTSEASSVCVIFSQFFSKSKYMVSPEAGLGFWKMISTTSMKDIADFLKFDPNDSDINDYLASHTFLSLSALLLCNFKSTDKDTIVDFLLYKLKKNTELDTMDKVLDYLFDKIEFPEPTYDYINKEERSDTELIKWAKVELDLLVTDDDSMQKSINSDILEIVSAFSGRGFTGFTVSYALDIVNRLIQFKPLTPLTGEDDEWNEITEGMPEGEVMYQNKRCSAVMKNGKDNSSAYYIDGKIFTEDGGKSWFTSRDSFIPVTFPFTVPEKSETVYLEARKEEAEETEEVMTGGDTIGRLETAE